MKNSSRRCAICNYDKVNILHQQHFQSLSNVSLMEGYDVVSCMNCGFVYADGIPEKEQFDLYYAQNSKYEFSHNSGQQHSSEIFRLKKLAEWVREQLSPSLSLIDVGCATGELLVQLRNCGFKNLTGLDPSPSCVKYAGEHHKLEVIQGVLDYKPQDLNHFDVLILSAVLEHIPELNLCLKQLISWIKPNGYILLEIPDAEFFADGFNAPFQEFSVEHINFFTAAALNNLMQKFGFKNIAERHYMGQAGNGTTSPVLTILYQRGYPEIAPEYESKSSAGIIKYLEKCRFMATYEAETIKNLVTSQKPILVWGTGTLCQRLLATTDFSSANIQAFIDSNPHYQGKQFHHKPVLSPAQTSAYKEAILITSWAFQEEIIKQIRKVLNLENEIITLMPVAH